MNRKLACGVRVHLSDGRTGTIKGTNAWGQYVVQPDDPTPEEQARDVRHLIPIGEARPFMETDV